MKLFLAMILLVVSALAYADPAMDKHARALAKANDRYTKDVKACGLVPAEAQPKCMGVAKTRHTKAVEKADAVVVKEK